MNKLFTCKMILGGSSVVFPAFSWPHFCQALGINYANVLHGDLTWCQEVAESNSGLLTRRFRRLRSSVLCGREKLPLPLTSLTEKKVPNRSPLSMLIKPGGVCESSGNVTTRCHYILHTGPLMFKPVKAHCSLFSLEDDLCRNRS